MSLLNVFLPPGDAEARCAELLSVKTSCDWTLDWSCPGSSHPGRSGLAGEDGSLAFFCCCKVVFPAELQQQRKESESAEMLAKAQATAKTLTGFHRKAAPAAKEQEQAPKVAVPSVPKPLAKADPTPAPITTYVIAPQEGFWEDHRVTRLRKLGLEVVRADPVIASLPCETAQDDPAMRGILLAHRNVWAAVALTGKRSLVLEADWSVPDGLLDAQLGPALHAAHAKDEDYTSVGWCDLCEDGQPEDCHSSPWSYYVAGCAHAYFVSPGAARALARTDFCIASDAALLGSCGNIPGPRKLPRPQWAHEHANLIGRNLSCSWLEAPSYRPPLGNATQNQAGGVTRLNQGTGSTFRGLFMQNISMSPSHNGFDNKSDVLGVAAFQRWRHKRSTALAMNYAASKGQFRPVGGHRGLPVPVPAMSDPMQQQQEAQQRQQEAQRSVRHRFDKRQEPSLQTDLRAVDELFANFDCKHVYLDIGTDIGVQIRKLYQPKLYPHATAQAAFEEDFGRGSRCNVCTFGFEPNPEHSERLDTVQSKLRAHGIGVHIFKKAAYTSYTKLQFATGRKDKKEQQITHVEAIDLAPIVQRIYGHLGKGGIITAKMDIEGDEFALLPHLERSQALCLISRIQMVWHPQYYEELEGRKAAAALGLEADVAGAKASESSVRALQFQMMELYAHPTGECKTWLQDKQDITYEQDAGNEDDWPQGKCDEY